MILSLRIGAPRIGGAPHIVRDEAKGTTLQEQQEHVAVLKMSAGHRFVDVIADRQPREIRSRSSSFCTKLSRQGHWTRGKLMPELYTGLKRSSNIEKRERMPPLKENDAVQFVLSERKLISNCSNQDNGFQESSLYTRFVDHAFQQCSQRMLVKPYPVKTEFRELVAKNGKSITKSTAFQAEKIRNFRAADINGASTIQVLNLVAFPSVTYQSNTNACQSSAPISSRSQERADLSIPLHSSLDLPKEYKDKYISPLKPVWENYSQLRPWGGEMTSEALQFFSPFVIWSRPINDQTTAETVFNAFKDYLHIWLDMVDKAEASKDVHQIHKNQAAQHRYMSWRSAKDPGQPLLTRLYGETKCEEYMKEFLFAELDNMGTQSFLDYFPHFKDPKGSVQKKRKAYSRRPWDEYGNPAVIPST